MAEVGEAGEVLLAQAMVPLAHLLARLLMQLLTHLHTHLHTAHALAAVSLILCALA